MDALGFVALAAGLIIGLGAIGVGLALIYLNLSKMGGSSSDGGQSTGSGDAVGDIIDNY